MSSTGRSNRRDTGGLQAVACGTSSLRGTFQRGRALKTLRRSNAYHLIPSNCLASALMTMVAGCWDDGLVGAQFHRFVALMLKHALPSRAVAQKVYDTQTHREQSWKIEVRRPQRDRIQGGSR